MREVLLTLVLLFVFLFVHAQRLPHGQLLPGLPGTVQLTYVFYDNKLFAGTIPTHTPYLIMKADEAKNNKSEFNLKQFANDCFLFRIGMSGDGTLILEGFGRTNSVLLNPLNHYHVDRL